jgi:hypothetical protein
MINMWQVAVAFRIIRLVTHLNVDHFWNDNWQRETDAPGKRKTPPCCHFFPSKIPFSGLNLVERQVTANHSSIL